MISMRKICVVPAVLGAVCVFAQSAGIIRKKDTFTDDKETDGDGNKWLKAMFDDTASTNVLDSGLMYKVLKKGSGTKHPLADTPCSCHYKGLLPKSGKAMNSWKQFDSSYDRGQPTTFAPNQVIKAWTEAMQKMVEGDKWAMYIPASLGYGSRGAGGAIPGKHALYFEMELIKINGKSVDKQEL